MLLQGCWNTLLAILSQETTSGGDKLTDGPAAYATASAASQLYVSHYVVCGTTLQYYEAKMCSRSATTTIHYYRLPQ